MARLIATKLVSEGVRRVFGLTGGHIKPIWDELARADVSIIDVRHEAAAVHMAQGHADATGELGVAIITAGPGLTNGVSGIASAYLARSPVLVLSGLPPRPQLGRGAFEEIPQAEIVAPVSRRSRTLIEPANAVAELDAAIAAAMGDDGPAGPAYLDVPIDVLRSPSGPGLRPGTDVRVRRRRPMAPTDTAIAEGRELLMSARRPLVILGRAARHCAYAIDQFVSTTGALYLETKESRGTLPASHPSSVSSLRSRACAETDLVVTLERQLDFELGYGSRAIFAQDPKFLRVGRTHEDLSDNRPGDVEVRGDLEPVMGRLIEAGPPTRLDNEWLKDMRAAHGQRVRRLREAMREASAPGQRGLHPYAVLAALDQHLADDTMITVDGGDIASFARIGLPRGQVFDTGAFGCLGVGLPFAVAFALARGELTYAVLGDGALGFNAMELDTAVRHSAPLVVVVSNNAAWGIERTDSRENYGGRPPGTELPGCRYDLLARALGAQGERVDRLEDLPGALDRAREQAPAVVDVGVSPDVVSPDFQGGLAELPDLQAMRAWNDAETELRTAGEEIGIASTDADP